MGGLAHDIFHTHLETPEFQVRLQIVKIIRRSLPPKEEKRPVMAPPPRHLLQRRPPKLPRPLKTNVHSNLLTPRLVQTGLRRLLIARPSLSNHHKDRPVPRRVRQHLHPPNPQQPHLLLEWPPKKIQLRMHRVYSRSGEVRCDGYTEGEVQRQ